MKRHDYLTLALTATILGMIIAMTPKGETITDPAFVASHGIDILGLTRNARSLPEEDYPAY